MASKAVDVNFVSRSQMRMRNRRPTSSRLEAKFLASWATHGRVGLAVTPMRCTTRRLIDDEQDVMTPEGHALDGKEVRSQYGFGLGMPELAPVRTGSLWRGCKAMATENGDNACLGGGDAELLPLPDDAQVAPVWVFPCDADDQRGDLCGQGLGGRPAGASTVTGSVG